MVLKSVSVYAVELVLKKLYAQGSYPDMY